MIGKLAFRNMKKSMSDYAVYFVTLIIGVSVFYVFNAISDQKIMLQVLKNDMEILELMKSTLSVASVIVSVVLAFLVVYASSFLVKRRKKEFGIYMLLGMGKGKIAGILMAETVIIGMISLVVGLGFGIIFSQGMSVLVAKLFEADMSKFTFDLSVGAVGKTAFYFLIMYALVLLLDVFVVGKSRLITLLNARGKTEKNTARNPWICLVVFAIAAVVLGHAYYMMTARIQDIEETSQLLLQIVKGIVSTILIFWSLSGLLIFLAKMRKKFYMKKLNAFTTKEISSRVNTNVIAGSIICLLLFITICVFSSSFSINHSLNENLRTLVPADVNFDVSYEPKKSSEDGKKSVSEVFRESGIDADMFRDVVELNVYLYGVYDRQEEAYVQDRSNVFAGNQEVVKLSDYNRVAKLYGLEQYTLAEDEYVVVADYNYNMQIYNQENLAKNQSIYLGGKEYHPKYRECKNGFLYMQQNPCNLGFTVVPDSVPEDENLHLSESFFVANYNPGYPGGTDKIDKLVNSDNFVKRVRKKAGEQINVISKSQIYQNSIGLTAMVVFLGLYLGIIFLIASSALLSLKELSQAADNREKYQILRKIGVDEKMIHRSLFCQNLIFFGIPLLLAVIHSVFGIQVCVYIVEVFGKTGLVPAILFTAAVILAVYAVYFVITYRCCRRIVDE